VSLSGPLTTTRPRKALIYRNLETTRNHLSPKTKLPIPRNT
jgi:hypothetical protein